MVCEFFGLSLSPFRLAPDPRFFYEGSGHRKALDHLRFAVEGGEGIAVLTGEAGCGKTAVLAALLAGPEAEASAVGRIVSSRLDGEDVLRAAADAFGLAFDGADRVSLVRRIEDFLVEVAAAGQHALLVVDEAHALSAAALDELRMLTNLQVGAELPLQVLLSGLPGLARRLAAPSLTALQQRIVGAVRLGAMDAADTRGYILHRLAVAGWRDDPAFTDQAFDAIHARTGGVPRRINLFTARLLLACCLDEAHAIDADSVGLVAEDLEREALEAESSS